MSRITVVMPCYRHEAYVAAAIESVLAQTFTDWELVAIDDCSPDGTLRVVERFRDPRIVVKRHTQNAGAHATINEGIALARGEWVTILNSDDLYAPERLAGLLAIAERTRADIVGTDIDLIDRHGRRIEKHEWLDWFAGMKSHYAAHGSALRTLLTGNVFITTSNLFFRKTTFDAVGPFELLRYTHDYEWLFRALQQRRTIHFEAAERTLSYRLHGENTILEQPLLPNRETFDLLLRYHDLMFQEPGPDISHEYTDHLRRILGNIEYVHGLEASSSKLLDRGLRRLVQRVLPAFARR